MCIEIGSWAEWVAAAATLAAVIVAGIALRHSRQANERSEAANEIARGAYIADVQARKEAQARLVFPRVVFSSGYSQGQVIPYPESPGFRLVATDAVQFTPAPPTSEPIATRNVQVVDIVVSNRSSEPIGEVRAELFDESTGKMLSPWVYGGSALPGEDSDIMRIVAPTGGPYLPAITFRDSAGVWWSRLWYQPIQELDSERRTQFERFDTIWMEARASRGPDQPWGDE